MTGYLRSQVSKAAGVHAETLRFYERNGLLPEPQRTAGGYRIYPEDIIIRLEFIKRAKNCGFTLNEISHLLGVIDAKNFDEPYISDLLEKKIVDIDNEISDMNAMKTLLKSVKDNINGPKKCPVLQSLLGDRKEIK